MNAEELLEQTSAQCEALRIFLQHHTVSLQDFTRRLLQILQQLHKNIEVRDTDFSTQFNTFCQDMRDALNKREPVWTELRAQIRQVPQRAWSGDLALDAKGFNSRAKALSRACDEFSTAYDLFNKYYQNYTAAKLNVFLLTSCQTEIANLTGKIVFLARELARKTEQNRSPYER